MINDLREPCRYKIFSSKEENEIRGIFYAHWEKMKNQMKVTIEQINIWRSQSLQEINSYAEEQIHILYRDYNQQQSIFENKREENLETARSYRDAKQKDLFHELSAACRSLGFHVAKLAYVQTQNQRLEVITVEEQSSRVKQGNTNTDAFEFVQNSQKSTSIDANITEKNASDIARSSSEFMSAVSNTAHQQSRTTPSSNYNNGSVGSGNSPEVRVTNNNDSNDKCPVCFMIFPLNMTLDNRQRHVNEHMADNQDNY